MNLYIGVDLGTSAMKLLLMDGLGNILNTVSKAYPLEFPRPGWSQQDPADWKKALFEGIPELLRGFDSATVAGIGVGVAPGFAGSGNGAAGIPKRVVFPG